MKLYRRAAAILVAASVLLTQTPADAGVCSYEQNTEQNIEQNIEQNTVILGNGSQTNFWISESQIGEQGLYTALQSALDWIRDHRDGDTRYKVIVAPGSYQVDRTISIYSNTTLVLDGVRLYQTPGHNVIRLGQEGSTTTNVTGYYYQNITIQGGTIDGNKSGNTFLRLSHGKNITLKNMVLENAHNSHMIEAAGIDGLKITGCIFRRQTLDSKFSVYTYEAIQLDIITKAHLYAAKGEDLTMKNILIRDCSFYKVPRGIGSHTNIMNNPFYNILIEDNTFDDLSSVAIQALDWKNCTIRDNTIKNTPRGIVIYRIQDEGRGTYTAQALSAESGIASTTSSRYQKPVANSHIVIKDNKITLNEKQDPYAAYERVGILVCGGHNNSSPKFSDGSGSLPKGNYYISGVTVSGNHITTKAHGVRLLNVQNAKVLRNVVNCRRPKDVGVRHYFGIEASQNSKKIVINRNIVRNASSNAIYILHGSSATSIDHNQITNAGKYGIGVEESQAARIRGNKINGTKAQGILVYRSARVNLVTRNTIIKPKNFGIHVSSDSRATMVTRNQIRSSGDWSIIFSTRSKGTAIKDNRIRNAKKKKIYVSADSKVKHVKKMDQKHGKKSGKKHGKKTGKKHVKKRQKKA